MKWLFISALAFCAFFFSPVQAEEVFNVIKTVAPWQTADDWQFNDGGEFKGAAGSVTKAADGIRLSYDFNNGGVYVAMVLKSPQAIPSFETLHTDVEASEDAELKIRITDKTGRIFQTMPVLLKKNQKVRHTVSMNGPWETAWSGKVSKNPQFPLKQIWILASRKDGLNKQGHIDLLSFQAGLKQNTEMPPREKEFTFHGNGWIVKGKRDDTLSGIRLHLRAEPVPGAGINSELELSLKALPVDLVKRIRLNPADGIKSFYYQLPIQNWNGHNRYRLRFTLKNDNSGHSVFNYEIRGENSGKLNLGDAVASTKIPVSGMGTNVHFSYSHTDAFQGWRKKEQILDEISACGLKWIRDVAGTDKDGNGEFKVRPADLETLAMAKQRMLRVVLIIDMYAQESLPVFLKRVEAVVRMTKEFNPVYELGNEPNNFGGWIKKYGGNWNGNEKNGTVSPWIVEHLKYTNAGAKKIKEIHPKATVIGIGAPSSANFQYLKLDIDSNLDGIVDHPYAYSLPPEKIPWGTGLEKRDGIKIGDSIFSFAGLIRSYREAFRMKKKNYSIWLTEFGYTTYQPAGKTWKNLFSGYTELAQAVYLLRFFLEAQSLEIAVSCQYDFLDDYRGWPAHGTESHFGILRGDYSRKPAFYAIQRLSALMHSAKNDDSIKIRILNDGVQTAARRKILAKWDSCDIPADNGIRVHGFSFPENKNERILALWSALPYSEESAPRSVSLELDGLQDFQKNPVMIDLLSGETCDVPLKAKNGKLLLEDFPLPEKPVLIKFFRNR